MNPFRLRSVHVLPKQQRPLRSLLHYAASICPQRLFMSPRLGQRASRPLQAPARPLATRGGIWRNPNPFSYFHTFTLPQFHIFTFPTAARSTDRRRGHSRLPRGGFSTPDISALFGMRRLAPPPTPCLAEDVENVIILKSTPEVTLQGLPPTSRQISCQIAPKSQQK